ncbi:MAG: AAA family ATPase [Candidatus Obscuribacterales bacterium]|nr:AAA family ATPase [Candidatus Obscuribacterales bacterium]
MMNSSMSKVEQVDLPKGIQKSLMLPCKALGALWNSIIMDEDRKNELVNQSILNFTVRTQVARSVLPLHGVILLVGPPGTGKTSLARGLANRTAESFFNAGRQFRLLEVEPHSLTSAAMGKTQRTVTELFSQTIAEVAASGPTIVLLDEVETLAADRVKLSLEANPIDVHRATDAVLVQLDLLAEQFPALLFIATSNFPEAVDAAFTSRCDLISQIPLPNAQACDLILRDCLKGLGQVFPPIAALQNLPEFSHLSAACVGLDGRTIRKVVANGMAQRQETAIDPNQLTINDLIAAATKAKSARAAAKGAKI